jgi:hydrogenase maturation protein HypF
LPSKTARVVVRGIVQGVGFRPFAAKLATDLGLGGSVKNCVDGVSIIISGDARDIELFLYELQNNPPVLAKIESIEIKECELRFFDGFRVEESDVVGSKNSLFPPDLTICEECQKELFDKNDRRFLYPLINCQNCGPRFTVIESLPYDRGRTTMRFFEMCEECKKEYLNILDRRFHAEPVSCPACGPSFYLKDGEGKLLYISKEGEILKKVAAALDDAKIVALKGVGGFHLLCRADSDEAVLRLREKKQRAKKPLAVMFKDIDSAKKECWLESFEESLVLSKERPITIVKKSSSFSLSRHISHDSPYLGIFLPYSGTYSVLTQMVNFPIVATSANISDEPIVTDEEELFERLSGVFDFAFYYDRKIVQGCDDSVVRASGNEIIKLRNSRGYAPLFLKSPGEFKTPVFCAGAHQKNCFAFAFGDQVAISPHIGDLGSIEASEYYEKSVLHMKSLWGIDFGLSVCDKNDRYASSEYAASLGVKLLRLQHHKAHFLASLYEKNALKSDAIGVVWDGTGLGDDGSVWGGEFFLKKGYEIERIRSLPYFWLLGGEKAAKDARKSALSLALSFLSPDEAESVACKLGYSSFEQKILFDAFDKKINCYRTSSMGRLFDGVAALAGVVCGDIYEGESGLMLEAEYNQNSGEYFDVLGGVDIDVKSLLRAVIAEKEAQKIATMFVNTLAKWIKNVSYEYELPFYFSGGVFQNSALVGAIKRELNGKNINFHTALSPNDSSICVGQAAFASLYLSGHITKEEL